MLLCILVRTHDCLYRLKQFQLLINHYVELGGNCSINTNKTTEIFLNLCRVLYFYY